MFGLTIRIAQAPGTVKSRMARVGQGISTVDQAAMLNKSTAGSRRLLCKKLLPTKRLDARLCGQGGEGGDKFQDVALPRGASRAMLSA